MNKSNNKIICIIQARMNSTRLPGKVMKKISGKPMLWYVLNSLQYSKTLDHLVVATTKKRVDDQIVELCNKMNISVFRGNEKNVLNLFNYHRKLNKFSKSSFFERSKMKRQNFETIFSSLKTK